jgi:hypothetical protein
LTRVPGDHADAGDRLLRIERMIQRYRRAKDQRLQQQAIALWRKLEAHQALLRLEKPLERIH